MVVPILRLRDVLITSLHRNLIDEQALQFKQELLDQTHRTEARGVVIDISGIRVMDSFLSRLLGELAIGCRMMGAEPVLCGTCPEVAIALVEMGRDFGDVPCAETLEHALELLGILVPHGGESDAAGSLSEPGDPTR